MARHEHVRALLHHRDVVPVGTSRATELVHRDVTRHATGVRTVPETASLLPLLRERWQHHVRRLNGGPQAELFARLAVPWSRDMAVQVTGLSPDELSALLPLARELFEGAAGSTSGGVPAGAERAAAALAARLAASDSTADVQSVVALTHTLPCLLVNVWRLLWEQPAAAAVLQRGDVSVAAALDELLRLGGPARALFRECLATVEVGVVRIPGGARIVLHLHEANRDPVVFPDPHRLDFARPAGLQLALGDGAHRCPGRNVIRAALHIAVDGWLALAPQWELCPVPAGHADAPWRGGHAIAVPPPLPVQPIVSVRMP